MSDCEHLHYEIGDTKGVCRYYPNSCPFGKCKIARPKAIEQKKTAPAAKYEQPEGVKKSRKTKYDWDRGLPIMQEMRDAGNSWQEISKATGIPKQSLMNRWKWGGMTIRTGVGD